MDIKNLIKLFSKNKPTKIVTCESCTETNFTFPEGDLTIFNTFSGTYVCLFSFLDRYTPSESLLGRTKFLNTKANNVKILNFKGKRRLAIELERYTSAVKGMSDSGNELAKKDVKFIRETYRSQYFSGSVSSAFKKSKNH